MRGDLKGCNAPASGFTIRLQSVGDVPETDAVNQFSSSGCVNIGRVLPERLRSNCTPCMKCTHSKLVQWDVVCT